ncbi:MAG: YgiT-type zinc finger protein [bacterium]
MKVCSFCGHKELKKKRVQYLYKHNDHFLLVNDVPCEECEFCGEQYFQASTLKLIESEFKSIYSTKKKPKRELTMPVEDFSDLEVM